MCSDPCRLCSLLTNDIICGNVGGNWSMTQTPGTYMTYNYNVQYLSDTLVPWAANKGAPTGIRAPGLPLVRWSHSWRETQRGVSSTTFATVMKEHGYKIKYLPTVLSIRL